MDSLPLSGRSARSPPDAGGVEDEPRGPEGLTSSRPLLFHYLYITIIFMNRLSAPSSPPEEPAKRLQRLVQALVRRFAIAERAEVSCCGTTVAQAAALSALSLGGPVRAGDLGRRLGIEASTLSRNLDRLEARRLVRRVTDVADARARVVELTAAGSEAAASVAEQEEAFARSILDHLPDDGESDVLTALELLLEAILAATADCCPGVYDHLLSQIEHGR